MERGCWQDGRKGGERVWSVPNLALFGFLLVVLWSNIIDRPPQAMLVKKNSVGLVGML